MATFRSYLVWDLSLYNGGSKDLPKEAELGELTYLCLISPNLTRTSVYQYWRRRRSLMVKLLRRQHSISTQSCSTREKICSVVVQCTVWLPRNHGVPFLSSAQSSVKLSLVHTSRLPLWPFRSQVCILKINRIHQTVETSLFPIWIRSVPRTHSLSRD